tara:strand:+ start:243 stop:440 length:198 start_codon:yes stop_codon:yes gene_type:complete
MHKGEKMAKEYKKLAEEAKTDVKTDEERMNEAIESLKAQIQHHNTMLIKAQGALEVLTQLTERSE